MKKNSGGRKARQERREKIFFGVLFGSLALIVIMTVVQLVTGGGDQSVTYVVTEEGHVHTSDGQHVGTVEEVFGENGLNVTVTEDGHVHGADGSHLGYATDTGDGDAASEAAAGEVPADTGTAAE